mmetsp:Transcript_40788/g.127605  ORF Transcript_40788/g.127605 Transcript_40788/m.127605 type:complete len:281 (-) Transcript_40788:3088-3930(-)|eukprot:CAMPEP_0118885690 /NCGR_PEP_ID=MMETSP1163-20130328/24062_1 /TAXON_ID=124430 /ORGANISM="Phaeomonas parva, Strain CCMP2877" /LENGTH=280 /DNA_ID=CAMNT_0006823745 /DNA_START=162 /DNA_END=1004 /DNA_ORIENTATION=+
MASFKPKLMRRASLAEETLDQLRDVFMQFCELDAASFNPSDPMLSEALFIKSCTDSELVTGKRFTVNSCKLIFAKVKLRNKTAIAFDTYRRALHMVADDKGLQYQDVVETMISLGGPVPEPDAEAAPAAAAGESSNEGDVSAFAGTWHVERHETLDDFLKLMGAGWAARKAVGSQHPNHTITVTPGAVRIVVGGLLASDNTYPLDGTSIHTTSRGHDYEDYVDTSDGKLAIHKLRLEDGLRITLVKAFADGSGEVLTQTTTALKTDGTTATTTTWLSRAN